jgi:hypothetical protein
MASNTTALTSPPVAARLGSKAETLENLAPVVRTARVLPLFYFSVAAWMKDAPRLLAEIDRRPWGHQLLIVRSSTRHEDDPRTLMPGSYLSVPNVSGTDALRTAIEAVIGSYRGRADGKAFRDELVLVQPMVRDATMTGVIFTLDPNTGSPYLVINYTEDGDTAAVTSGHRGSLRTFFAWKSTSNEPVDPRLRRLGTLSRELEEVLGLDNLDVEFAFDRAGTLYLLQVRPLVIEQDADHAALQHELKAIAAKVRAAGQPHPHLHGRRAVFGVMPDWNPAEIVGTRPRPLALSLYRRLITDGQWAEQRARYGYRDVRGFPLMFDFCGLPYVDVRESFNSLIPGTLPDELARRLVDHYLDRLVDHGELHDKIEFDVVFSCYSFTVQQRLADQAGHVFTAGERAEIAAALRSLTNRLLDPGCPPRQEDVAAISALRTKLSDVRESNLDLPSQIYWVLEDCRRFGTFAFAGFARLGFIATEMLRSLVAVGVLDEKSVTELMSSLDTVTNRMLRDRCTLSRDDFLRRYGFLRPGTYDILSPRYDEDPDRYFDWPGNHARFPAPSPLRLPAETMRQIDALLRQHHVEQDAYGLMSFIVSSIELRENSKFEFSRHLSEALALLKQLGEKAGLDVDDLSFTTIDCVDELYRGTSSPQSVLRRSADAGRQQFELTRRLVLPPVIADPSDVTAFHLTGTEPNYITQHRVTGLVDEISARPTDVTGKILMLPSGDPGYDWIFTEGVAGFITRFGGANSHMAIRAHQLGIPAVIGAGEVLYDRWSTAPRLTIDCLNRRVEMLP